MITNIMGYGSQKGHKQVYNGVDFGGNLLPKVKVESIVSDETYEQIIDQIIEEINTGVYGDGKIFVYEVTDAFVFVLANVEKMLFRTVLTIINKSWKHTSSSYLEV